MSGEMPALLLILTVLAIPPLVLGAR